MWKKITILMTVAVLLYGMCMNASAAERREDDTDNARESEFSIMMTNISRQYNVFTINTSSGIATIQCSIKGKENITKTSITATLQKKTGNSWTDIKTWTATTNSNKTTLTKTKGVASGSFYRVKATFKAYKGKTCETKTTFSAVKKG